MMREAQKQDQLVGENKVKLQIESEKQKTELARLDVEREKLPCKERNYKPGKQQRKKSMTGDTELKKKTGKLGKKSVKWPL